MPTTTVSPKFQVVIPKELREKHAICAGQKVQFLDLGYQIVLVPIVEPEELMGILPIDSEFVRDKVDRLQSFDDATPPVGAAS